MDLLRKLFLLLALLSTFFGTSLAQASQVTDVKWGVDKQNMLRFVVDLTEPATYQVSAEGRMLLITVDAGLQPQAAGTKKIKSSITDVMTVEAQGQQTLVKVPLWRELPTTEYRSFVLKKDPQTKRPPRIVVDVTGTIKREEPAQSAVGNQPTAAGAVAGAGAVASTTKSPTATQPQTGMAQTPASVVKQPPVMERPAPGGKVVVSNKPTLVQREPKETGSSATKPTSPQVQQPVAVNTASQAAKQEEEAKAKAEAKAKEEAKAKAEAKAKEEAKEKAKREKKKTTVVKGDGEYEVDGGLKGKIITLDPGHGGSDPGAIGKNGTMEKDVTLEIALRVKEGLEKKGAKVYLTRSKDVDVYGPNASAVDELQARVNVAEKKNSDLFISIHINASTNAKLGGFSSYYYPKTSNDARIAQAIQKQLTANFGVDDLGIREANFYVIKRCSMPATLLELCFLSNPKEEAFLKGKWFPNKASKLIVDGIVDYFK